MAQRARELWRAAAAVCFDVDSTVCVDEGIDMLAAYLGKGPEVAEFTRRAMGGSILFEDALRARLDIMRPSEAQVRAFVSESPPKLTPGITDLVAALRRHGKAVYLVSGGFRQMIAPVAAALEMDAKDHVYANKLIFGVDGAYAGFDLAEPTSRSGGKAKVAQALKDRHGSVVVVGDGVTDMEARPPADLFVGFGGNVVREAVRSGADWFVLSFAELRDALESSM